SVMVIEGSAIVDIDGERITLRTFDTTIVPANIPHHFENASAEKPMRIFWTYASTDATRTIIASGEHSRIDTEDAEGGSTAPVREVARIIVDDGAGALFEKAVRQAIPLFQAAYGARSLTLERADENPMEYRLVVTWDNIADHTETFRNSEAFLEWRRLIQDSVSSPPEV